MPGNSFEPARRRDDAWFRRRAPVVLSWPVTSSTALTLVKLVHTAAWAFFAGCIMLLPVAAHGGRFDLALILVALVLAEVLILALNHWSCPLTRVAAGYTSDRRPNFDIFLPTWIARYNKQVFGSLFLLALIYTAVLWWRQRSGV